MNRSNRKNRPSSAARRPSRRGGELAGMPSQINVHPISSRVYRFGLNQDALNVTITRRCMLSLQAAYMPGTTIGVTTALTLIQAIRVKRISVWATATGVNINSFSVEWVDPHGPSTQKTASCTQMVAGHLTTVVPKDSFAKLWSQITNVASYNEPLFMLTLLPNSIVDVECDVVYADGTASQNETISRNVNPALPAGVGYAALDNSTTTGALGAQELGPIVDLEVTYI